MSCNLEDPNIRKAYDELLDPSCPNDYLLLGYADTLATITLYVTASGGLDALKEHFEPDEVMFALLRLEGRFLLVQYLSEGISGVRRARALVHGRAVSNLLRAAQSTISVARRDDLTEFLVRSKLGLDTGRPESQVSASTRQHGASTSRVVSTSSTNGPLSSSDRPSLPRVNSNNSFDRGSQIASLHSHWSKTTEETVGLGLSALRASTFSTSTSSLGAPHSPISPATEKHVSTWTSPPATAGLDNALLWTDRSPPPPLPRVPPPVPSPKAQAAQVRKASPPVSAGHDENGQSDVGLWRSRTDSRDSSKETSGPTPPLTTSEFGGLSPYSPFNHGKGWTRSASPTSAMQNFPKTPSMRGDGFEHARMGSGSTRESSGYAHESFGGNVYGASLSPRSFTESYRMQQIREQQQAQAELYAQQERERKERERVREAEKQERERRRVAERVAKEREYQERLRALEAERLERERQLEMERLELEHELEEERERERREEEAEERARVEEERRQQAILLERQEREREEYEAFQREETARLLREQEEFEAFQREEQARLEAIEREREKIEHARWEAAQREEEARQRALEAAAEEERQRQRALEAAAEEERQRQRAAAEEAKREADKKRLLADHSRNLRQLSPSEEYLPRRQPSPFRPPPPAGPPPPIPLPMPNDTRGRGPPTDPLPSVPPRSPLTSRANSPQIGLNRRGVSPSPGAATVDTPALGSTAFPRRGPESPQDRSPMFDSHRRAYTDAYDIRPDFYDTRPVDMWRGSPTSPRARRRQMDEQGLEGEPWIMRQTREREGFSDFSDRLDSRPPPAPEKDLPPPPPHDTPEMSPRLSGDSSVLQTGWEVEEARAAEARQRAIAAEEAARVQMERAREEQARLAAEVAEAERREKERIENEAAARAKWAAEQAARERLDAFERSKLEAAERHRREAAERLRREETRRADEARREKERRDIEERRAAEEAERRKRDAQEREIRLRQELDAKKRREAELAAREEQRKAERQELKQKFESLDLGGDVILNGNLTVQSGSSITWRRRWFELRGDHMTLCKSEKDKTQALERIELRGTIRDISDAFEECQMANSIKIMFDDRRADSLTVYTDTAEDKEILLCAIAVISRAGGA